MRIGFIGLGRMGAGMAARLIGEDHDVVVFDPDRAQIDRLDALGAQGAATLAQACRERDVVITMLPSDDILRDAAMGTGGIVSSLPAGGIHMISGTHGVAAVGALVSAHHAAGQNVVSCTVLGRPDRAADGKLGLVVSGLEAAIGRLRPVFERLGNSVFEAGEDPLSGVAVKIANNFVLGCAIEAMGEAMALVRKYQVEPALFQNVLTCGLFDCVAYRAYGDVIASQDWGRVGAAATIGLKDVDLALDAAERVDLTLPSGLIWRDHLIDAIARGEGQLDWSVMARAHFRNSGLE